ncbi:MAG TPA: histidine phosphatase family protein [candidate division Zixibacteria bacterium]|jgi:phosphohistidine phosphatase
MKTLYLVRHAEAVGKGNAIPDFERSLTPKGIKSVRAVARRLAKRDIRPDQIVSSPANRALETAHIFAKTFEYPLEQVVLKSALYDDQRIPTLLEVLRGLDESVESALLCGHDPLFTEAAGALIEGFDKSLPKGAVVGMSVEGNEWASVMPGRGRFILYDYPMSKTELQKRHKVLRRRLTESMVAELLTVLDSVDPIAAKAIRDYTTKACRRVASRFVLTAGHAALMPMIVTPATPPKDAATTASA